MADHKKQHAITRAYLDNFTSIDSKMPIVCQYAKADGTIVWSNTKNLATANYLYSIPRKDGSWNHGIEHALGLIETKAIPVLKKIISGQRYDEAERYHFAVFLASMMRRPKHIMRNAYEQVQEMAKDTDYVMVKVDELLEEGVIDFDKREAFREKLMTEGFEVPEGSEKSGIFLAWAEHLPDYASYLSAMRWQVLKARESFFVTSDNPAFVRRSSESAEPGIVGLVRWSMDAKAYFPLSSKRFLIISHHGSEDRQRATKTQVEALNAIVIRMADRYIYAREKSSRLHGLIQRNNSLPAPLPAPLQK